MRMTNKQVNKIIYKNNVRMVKLSPHIFFKLADNQQKELMENHEIKKIVLEYKLKEIK